MNFYEAFVNLCNDIGLSPSLVAEKIGIQKSTVSHWSKGSNPSFSTKNKVAKYFNIPISYFDCIEDNTPPPKYSCGKLTNAEERIVFCLRSMAQKRRTIFYSLIQDGSLSYFDTSFFADYQELNTEGRKFMLQAMAMAKQSYSKKNLPVSELEAVE